MDTGKDIDVTNELEKPTSPVAGIAEEGGKPQTADDESKFVIDIDGDQETAEFDENEFKKQRAMAAKRKKQLEEAKEREAERDKRIAELEAKLAQVTAPKKPSLADYDYDEDKFADAMAEYVKSQSQVTAPSHKQEQEQETDVGDDYELNLIRAKSESKVKSVYPSYEQDLQEFEKVISDNGGNPEVAKNAIAAMAREADLDYARVMLGLAKFPNLYQKAISAKSQLQLAKVLEEAQNNIVLRANKRVESTPEPKIKSSGAVDVVSAEVAKLRQAWLDDSNNPHKYEAYKAAKQKLKS